jgi:3-methyl-2-oxobutanoate hydroxymethyltransferase
MSRHIRPSRITVPELRSRKGQTPIVVLTAYTAPMARLMDEEVDILLVGDSLGMVIYGMESTLPVSLEMMIAHGAAVVRGSERACVVVDMPFGSYQSSPAQAFESCARVLRETGCHAVKLEGGAELAETIRFVTERGIPVMAHIGLMPQRVNVYGGYKSQGKVPSEADAIRRDALAVTEAGAFSLLIEAVQEPLARELTEKLAIPTIGIGASPACDGQVLVTEDMLGLLPSPPRFVKPYAALEQEVKAAIRTYATEVRSRTFPAAEHCYGIKR